MTGLKIVCPHQWPGEIGAALGQCGLTEYRRDETDAARRPYCAYHTPDKDGVKWFSPWEAGTLREAGVPAFKRFL